MDKYSQNKYNIQVGHTVCVDRKYNNASFVSVLAMTPSCMYSEVLATDSDYTW